MADIDDENDQTVILDGLDDAVVTRADAPEAGAAREHLRPPADGDSPPNRQWPV